MTTDGTEERKDESVEDTSGGDKGTSEDAITYDQTAVEKIKNDALAAAGRSDALLKARETAIKEAEDAEAERQTERDEAAREAARGHPEQISIIDQRRQNRLEKEANAKERTQMDKEKLELQVKIDAINATTKGAQISVLAEKYKVDVADLKDLNLDIETVEKLAVKLSTLSPEELEKVTKTAVVPKNKRDSGESHGGGEKSQEDRLKEMYPSMYPK